MFFFFLVNGGGQRRRRRVARVRVRRVDACLRLRRVDACLRMTAWARERVKARGRAALRVWERGRVAGVPEASGGAWARVWRARNFWRHVGARAGPDPADFGLNGQIVMRSIQ